MAYPEFMSAVRVFNTYAYSVCTLYSKMLHKTFLVRAINCIFEIIGIFEYRDAPFRSSGHLDKGCNTDCIVYGMPSSLDKSEVQEVVIMQNQDTMEKMDIDYSNSYF